MTVAALRSATGGAAAAVLARCFDGADVPIMGAALLAEHEDVLSRPELWADVPVTREERELILDALCSVARWQPVWFLWRPNLPDEHDNHGLELAVAGGACHLVTSNPRDFGGELHFGWPAIVTPVEHLRKANDEDDPI